MKNAYKKKSNEMKRETWKVLFWKALRLAATLKRKVLDRGR